MPKTISQIEVEGFVFIAVDEILYNILELDSVLLRKQDEVKEIIIGAIEFGKKLQAAEAGNK